MPELFKAWSRSAIEASIAARQKKRLDVAAKATRIAAHKKAWEIRLKRRIETAVAVKFPPVMEMPAEVRLTEAQKGTIDFAKKFGLITEDRIRDLGKTFGVTEHEIREISTMLASQPLVVRRRLLEGSGSYKDVLETGQLKNQFQIAAEGKRATSSGSLGPYKGSSRDSWEGNFGGGVLKKSEEYEKLSPKAKLSPVLAAERPVYGQVYDSENPIHAVMYGDIIFVLKPEAKARATFTMGNSSLGVHKNSHGTLKPMENYGMVSMWIRGKSNPSQALKNRTMNFSKGISYVETQIYGGIKFDRDVERIVSERKEATHFASKFKIPLQKSM